MPLCMHGWQGPRIKARHFVLAVLGLILGSKPLLGLFRDLSADAGGHRLAYFVHTFNKIIHGEPFLWISLE